MKITKEERAIVRSHMQGETHVKVWWRVFMTGLIDALDDADAEIERLTAQLAVFKEIERRRKDE